MIQRDVVACGMMNGNPNGPEGTVMTADLSREKLNLRAAGSVARTVTVLLSVIMLASPSVPTLTTDCVVQESDIILRSSTLTELFSALAMVSGDVLLEQLA